MRATLTRCVGVGNTTDAPCCLTPLSANREEYADVHDLSAQPRPQPRRRIGGQCGWGSRLGRLHALVTARIPRYPVHKPEDNMPIWVPTAISIFFGLAGICATFYFKWVPDIEVQKRHMKGLGWWLLDLVTLGAQITSTYLLAQHKGPVTSAFVVATALIVDGLVLCIVLFGFRRRVLRFLPKVA